LGFQSQIVLESLSCDDYFNSYTIWVALSPCNPSVSSGKVFIQAGIILAACEPVHGVICQKVKLFFIYFNGFNHTNHTFFSEIYPFSKFAGTKISVLLSYSNGEFTVCFNDNNCFSLTLKEDNSSYSFIPRSALIIGEAPCEGCINGTRFFSYPVSINCYNLKFYVTGTANVPYACVYTLKYALNMPIYVCYTITSSGETYYYFEWTYNGNSYSASACTACVGSAISGSIHLGFSKTKIYES